MNSFRTPRYLERYEDVVFDLEQSLKSDPNDTQYQNRDGMKILADITGETTAFDWYNARLSIDFKVDKLVDHAAIAVNDNIGMVNGSNTLIKKLIVTANGRQVYDCDYANHCVNIKNLLEYNPSYAKSVERNEFYFPDILIFGLNVVIFCKRSQQQARLDEAMLLIPLAQNCGNAYKLLHVTSPFFTIIR